MTAAGSDGQQEREALTWQDRLMQELQPRLDESDAAWVVELVSATDPVRRLAAQWRKDGERGWPNASLEGRATLRQFASQLEDALARRNRS